jgi:hypothetical protein
MIKREFVCVLNSMKYDYKRILIRMNNNMIMLLRM